MAAPTFSTAVRTEDIGGSSVPDALVVSVSANDDDERLRFVSRFSRAWVIDPATVGDHIIPLARLGFALDESLTVETVNANVYWSAATQTRTLLTTPVASTLPGKPTVTTNFTLGTFDPETGFAFDEAAQVDDGGGTISKYIIKADAYNYQAEALVADLPVNLPFAPDTVSDWPEGDDSFDVSFTVAAQNETGIGPASNVVSKTVTATDSYYLDNADWTATSIQTLGDTGNIDIAISGGSGFALVAPWDELWCYAGPVPTITDVDISSSTLLPSQWMAVGNTLMSQISVGDTVRIPTGLAQGETAYSVIAMRRSDTGKFFIISLRKTTTVLAPTVTAPVFAAAPTITGLVSHSGITKADVGVQLTLSGEATGTGTITYTSVFRLNGVAVGSATAASSTTYTPVAADIGKTIDGRVTATNSGGTSGRNTAANYPVVDVAPTATGALSAQSYSTADGSQTIAAATVTARFTGARLNYAIAANALGATIDSTTGEITIPAQTAEISDQITVSASNTGGTATLPAFSVTFTVPADVFAFPAFSTWSVRESTSSDGVAEGILYFTVGAVTVPTGYRMRAYAVAGALPTNPTLPLSSQVVSANTSNVRYTQATFAVGAQVNVTIYRERISDGALRANNTITLTIQGFSTTNPPGTWTTPSNAILTDANGRNGERFSTSEAGVTVGGHFGGVHAALIFYAWLSNNNTQYDSKILTVIRGTLGGSTCPPCRAGFSNQLEVTNGIALYVMAKQVPRLWSAFTAEEKDKMEWLTRAVAAASAWSTSDFRWNNAGSGGFVSRTTKMDGTANNFPRGNPNYQMACPFAVSALIAFLGSASAVNTWFNSGPANLVSSNLIRLGLTNASGSGRAWAASRPSGAPTFSEVNTCISNWRFKGRGVLDFEAILKEQIDFTWKLACFTQHPQSGSIGGRGRVIDGTPTSALSAMNGRIGMPSEMASSNGGSPNIRTSATYSYMEVRQTWVWLLMMMMSGLVARNGATMKAIKAQLRVGWDWFNEMSRNNGWLNYANGGSAGQWSYADNGQQYGYTVNMGMLDLVVNSLGDASNPPPPPPPDVPTAPLYANSIASTDHDLIHSDDTDHSTTVTYLGIQTQNIERQGPNHNQTLPTDVWVYEVAYDDTPKTTLIYMGGEGVDGGTYANKAAADVYVAKFVPRLGKLPLVYRRNIHHMESPGGNGVDASPDISFTGDPQPHYFTIYPDRADTRIANNDLEESFFHEATHASIQALGQGVSLGNLDTYDVLNDPAWAAAVAADGPNGYITQYAKDNSGGGEDLAEHALYVYTLLFNPTRLPEPDRTWIAAKIPNRIAYLRQIFERTF